MSDCAQKCTSQCIVTKMIFLTYSQKFLQNIQFHKLELSEIILVLCFLFHHDGYPPW